MVDAPLNWLNWLHFLIIEGGLLVILIDCIIFLSAFLDFNDVNDAQYFSILCDEASNTSNKEQLSFCFRYVYKKGEIVKTS